MKNSVTPEWGWMRISFTANHGRRNIEICSGADGEYLNSSTRPNLRFLCENADTIEVRNRQKRCVTMQPDGLKCKQAAHRVR